MIDYNELADCLTGYFDRTIVFNKQGAFAVAQCKLIKGVTIYSGEFFFHPKGVDLYFFTEISFNQRAEYESIVASLQKVFSEYRLGKMAVGLKEKHGRLWIGFRFTLAMPHPCVEEAELNSWLSVGVFRDFVTDMNGYAPVWVDKKPIGDYVSKWVLTPQEGGYTKLLGRFRIGDKLNLTDDD